MTKIEELKNLVCNQMPKGLFGVVVRTKTTPTMPQRRRGGAINPYYGRVIKYTQYSQIAIGYGYSQYANAQLTRKFGKPTHGNGQGEQASGVYTDWESGREYPIFHSNPMSGREWNEGMYALISHSTRDESKEYLRITYKPNTLVQVIYFLDGVQVTDKQTACAIAEWENTKDTPCIYGIDGIKVKVKDIHLENVLAVMCGNYYYHL